MDKESESPVKKNEKNAVGQHRNQAGQHRSDRQLERQRDVALGDQRHVGKQEQIAQ